LECTRDESAARQRAVQKGRKEEEKDGIAAAKDAPLLLPNLPNRVPFPIHHHSVPHRGRVSFPFPHVLVLKTGRGLGEIRVLCAGLSVSPPFDARHVLQLTRGRRWETRGHEVKNMAKVTREQVDGRCDDMPPTFPPSTPAYISRTGWKRRQTQHPQRCQRTTELSKHRASPSDTFHGHGRRGRSGRGGCLCGRRRMLGGRREGAAGGSKEKEEPGQGYGQGSYHSLCICRK
jgi:hypothetical protein